MGPGHCLVSNRCSPELIRYTPDQTTTNLLMFSYIASIILTSANWCSHSPLSSHCHLSRNSVNGFLKVHKTQCHISLPLHPLLSTSCLSENIPSVISRYLLKSCCFSPNWCPIISSNLLSKIISSNFIILTQQNYSSALPWVLCISFPLPYGHT